MLTRQKTLIPQLLHSPIEFRAGYWHSVFSIFVAEIRYDPLFISLIEQIFMSGILIAICCMHFHWKIYQDLAIFNIHQHVKNGNRNTYKLMFKIPKHWVWVVNGFSQINLMAFDYSIQVFKGYEVLMARGWCRYWRN